MKTINRKNSNAEKTNYYVCEYTISPTGDVTKNNPIQTKGVPCASPIEFNRKIKRSVYRKP